MRTKGIEAFQVGRQRDSAGGARLWEPSDLDEMASAYNETLEAGKHEAPILIGHDGNTSFGWVEKAYRDGDILKLDYRQVDKAFAEAANAGRYKKRSISIYPRNHPDNPTPGRLNIRHLAYVGIPAIKGLSDHTFNDSGEGFLTLEFSALNSATAQSPEATDFMEWSAASAFSLVAGIFQKLRDRLIAESGVEEADKVLPSAVLADLGQMTTDRQGAASLDDVERLDKRMAEMEMRIESRLLQMTAAPNCSCQSNNYQETTMSGSTTGNAPDSAPAGLEQMQERLQSLETNFAEATTSLAAAQQSITELQTSNAGLKLENERLREYNENLEKGREQAEVANFVEGLVREAKVLPADKDSKIQMLLAVPASGEFDFGEAGKMSPRARVMADLAASKPLYSTGGIPLDPADAPEFAERRQAEAKGFDADSDRLHRQVLDYAAKHGVTYEVAMDALEVTT